MDRRVEPQERQRRVNLLRLLHVEWLQVPSYQAVLIGEQARPEHLDKLPLAPPPQYDMEPEMRVPAIQEKV